MATKQKNARNEQINLVDLFFFLLNHWYWSLICAAIALGYAWYKYSKSPLVYQSKVTVVIKDPSNTTRSVRMDSYSNIINSVDMTNEILQLRSKAMMSEAVSALDADVNYQIHEKLRDIELYRNAPIRIFFSREEGEDPGSFSIKVTPLDSKTLRVEGPAGVQTVALDDTVSLGQGKVVFQPTANYNESAFGREIKVTKQPVRYAAVEFLSRLNINQESNILTLSLQDYSVQRACDVLGMLVDKYNEDAVSFDFYDLIGAYTGPVLILHGDKDPIVPLRYSQRAAEVFPNAELIVMPGQGHGFMGKARTEAMGKETDFFRK